MFFGITALLLTGASWCLTGAIMGGAPRHRIDASMIQLGGSVLSLLIGTVLLVCLGSPVPSPSVLILAGGCYLLSGTLNCIMLQLMSYAMQYGPNGIVWSIIQSALIFSFLGGILFFGVELTPERLTGIILLAAALILFGRCKDNTNRKSQEHNWKKAAFLALLLAAIQQNLSTAPSYFPAAREMSSILRTLLNAAGTFMTAAIWQKISCRDHLRIQMKLQLKNPYLWYYIGGLQIFSLFFSYLCLYPGMDALAKHGAGAISYPLMVGSCIVSFTLYSRFYLKEAMPFQQLLALLICIAGLVSICL